MTIHHSFNVGSIGEIQLIGGDAGLQALSMKRQRHFIDPAAASRRDPDAALFIQVRDQLESYFAGELRAFDIPIDLQGTPSQLALWTALTTIPYGQTTTYGELATRLGSPGMAQAVGQGVGHNPIAIIVPCHRVIGADGSLTGYAGGLDRKRTLLTLEGILQPTLL